MLHLKHRASRLGLALVAVFAVALLSAGAAAAGHGHSRHGHSLWRLYDSTLVKAKYVDLTHTITPSIPVWSGFGPSVFSPTTNPATGQPYTYATDGFEATSLSAPDRPARHAARSAGALGAGVRGDRRVAPDVRRSGPWS